MSSLVSVEMRLEFGAESAVITQVRPQRAMYYQVLLHRAFRCKSTTANRAGKRFLTYNHQLRSVVLLLVLLVFSILVFHS